MPPALADIALPVPIDRTFTYLVPPALSDQIAPGMRAIVPFGRKHLTGVVVAFRTESSIPKLKPIRDILDASPFYSPELLALTRWIADYYLEPWGEVLKAAAPRFLPSASSWTAKIRPECTEAEVLKLRTSAPAQFKILTALASKRAMKASQLKSRTGISSMYSILNALAGRGLIELTEEIHKYRDDLKRQLVTRLTSSGLRAVTSGSLPGKRSLPSLTDRQRMLLNALVASAAGEKTPVLVAQVLKETGVSLSVLRALQQKACVEILWQEKARQREFAEESSPDALTLNESQQSALSTIFGAIDASRFEAFLLHGVTGSGKTQVYIEAIRKVLEKGKTAIVLVPEIALTPQIVHRFKSHFGSQVAVLHSQLSSGERFEVWRLAQSGSVKIVIGPRSAVFAPLDRLGLIVVDEEHESTYKQFDTTPRYHARDVAVVRASQSGAVIILGSATPSIESYFNTEQGKYKLLTLPERIDAKPMPPVEIIDLRGQRTSPATRLTQRPRLPESSTGVPPFPGSISKPLQEAIASRLTRREGIILFQNRRGFSHVVECHECGFVEMCDHCEVTLTYHISKRHLRCHYCGAVRRPRSLCPSCGGSRIRYHAFGTQQVHEELKEHFPEARILRMDVDTTSSKGAHARFLREFAEGGADILLGTQMVAKGLDFPNVTLVGVISADTQILLPDFRSSERTFQLLTQVAGRTGRSALGGEVIIQTLQSDHYSLKYVRSHDFNGFYREELAYRRELDYPPFSRIVLIEFRGPDDNGLERIAAEFADLLRKKKIEAYGTLLGPSDAPIRRISNLFRKQIVFKNLKEADPAGNHSRGILLDARGQFEQKGGRGARKARLIIDVDPQGMM